MNSRVAVITGAAQGIGRCTAELLSELGYRVGLIDLREPTNAIQSIQSRGGHVVSYTGDITDEGAVLDFAALVYSHYGRGRPRQQRRHQPHRTR